MGVKRLALLFIATVFPAVAFAQEPAPAATPDAPVTADAPAVAGAEAAGAEAAGAEAAPQDPTEELFAEKCASCHSVGKGDRVGPDLKGAHERRDRAWLLRMVKTPNAMLDSDADARALLKKFNNVRMPDLGLSDDQANALVDLIARCSVETCNLAGVFVAVTESTADDIEAGRKLFLGETSLTNGGPPCVSCHTARGTGSSVAGGTLAKDLTHVFARLGDEGLDAALRNPEFPLMKEIYAGDRAMVKEEAFSLRAFFAQSNRAVGEQDDTYSVLLAGILGAVLMLMILNALWSRRLRGVRKPLTQAGGVS